jgi:tRNA 2-(methylsulfanyl)-N6-isopentenyladenosine37 hydroxylase
MSLQLLAAPTPAAWVEAACEHWQELLLDHAACEKKAASSALALIFAYPEFEQQNLALSRLAREELRHFEQVTRLQRDLRVPFRRLRPARYAGSLRLLIAPREPQRRIDLLLVAALIEARSCERFQLLATRLAAPLGSFYAELEPVESRHAQLYLRWAEQCGGASAALAERLAAFSAAEAELITTAEDLLRFHSGPPGPRSSSR